MPTCQHSIRYQACCTCLLGIVTAVLCLALSPPAVAASPPLVAGFERFGRTGDIGAATAGRLLLTELSCTACHTTDSVVWQPKRGPSLDGVANRLQSRWIKRFLLDPESVHPGTTMPALLTRLSDAERAEAADALTAYLGSLQKPLPEIRSTGLVLAPHAFWERGDAAIGSGLFHRVGCVACHAGDENYETAEVVATGLESLLEQLDEEELQELGLLAASRSGPVQPLGRLADKYSAHSLTLFLLNPTETRPAGRMPHMNLTPTEAADIAAYLMQRTKTMAQGDEGDAGEWVDIESLVETGRRWFSQLQCAQCHETGDESLPLLDGGAPDAPTLQLLGDNVLTGPREVITDCRGAPDYPWDDDQRFAVASALATLPSLQGEGDTGDQPALGDSLLQLNCFACHERNGLGGVARDRRPYFETVSNEDLGDEGRFPPPLTRVEEKLQPQWLARVLQGNSKIRPHMHARMPQVAPSATKRLSELFAQSAERARGNDYGPQPPVTAPAGWPGASDAQTLAAGRAMMDAGCVQCHQYAGDALPGVVGVDLLGIGDRMRPEWFYRFLCDPGSLKPRTRMPSFFPDGQSQQPDLLGGDRDRQIAAMWGYLKDLAKQPLPAKIEQTRSQDYELRPTDSPILLRTFMPPARTHAIAVGFPQGVHLALDADAIRLAALWRGRFLDAQGTWFVRAAPPAQPLGVDLRTMPPGSDFRLEPSGRLGPVPLPAATQAGSVGIQTPFRGYSLDVAGVPEFRYQFGPFRVYDHFHPLDQPSPAGFQRTITIEVDQNVDTVSDVVLWFRVAEADPVDGTLSIPEPLASQRQRLSDNDTGDDDTGDDDTGDNDTGDNDTGGWYVPLARVSGGPPTESMKWEFQYRW